MSKKTTTLYPDEKIQKDPHDFTDDIQFPLLFIIMMPNTIGTIAKAIRHNDYPLAAFAISVIVCFFLLQFCLSKYLSAPKHNSTKKFWLKLNMWFLYTVTSFGVVYQFADFFTSQMTMSLYMVVLLCSMFLFYVFVIVDVVNFWKIRGEDGHCLPENQSLDATKMNCYSVSIWEKV
ncbi:hypothetical protein CTI12_AA538670 [Artemisia annua]|uniref:Uncharacterized protein n=1 Tax=Artemisia annua TaxID=35608 RepID=A0A2U1L2A4_ARTAN|nr:hypothetical protein CTI12_AA538670 [Artemisia annua]